MRLLPADSRLPRPGRAATLLLVGWSVALALVARFGPPDLCTFHRLTGWPCPGCGSTRVLLALSQGDVVAAARLNPLWFAVLVAALGWMVLRIGFQRRLVVLEDARAVRRCTLLLVVAVLANWGYLLATLPAPPGSRHASPDAAARE